MSEGNKESGQYPEPEFVSREMETTWLNFIEEFNTYIVPHFITRGYSNDAALLAFCMNRLYNVFSRTDDDDDNLGGWTP